MILRCLGTGSSGNCYLLCHNDEVLVLDAGIPIRAIKKGLNWQLGGIQGVLCTHEHKDHNKSLEDFRNMGMRIFAPFCIGNVKSAHCKMGGFDVNSFDLPHNGVWNSGFLIKAGGQTILYMTDFEYCQYIFKKQKVNHIICECNYQQELVERDLPNYEHKIRGHCSLETCKNFIAANKTNTLKTVILCHMGAETTVAEECLAEVQKVAGEGVKCVCAAAGETVELSLTPF